MTDRVNDYLDGAAMAYHDVSKKLLEMIAKAPIEIKPFMEHMRPFADSCAVKAVEVYKEADRYLNGIRQ